MRTEFSPLQLQDPDTREVEKIFRSCVHCGFCNATCPTYLLKGDELDGPRGRIYLLKDMLENESIPEKKVVKHIDRCLSCLSCMTTCPSGVNYMHLIDHGRAYIEKTYKRSIIEKIFRQLLAITLPQPSLFRPLSKIGKLASPLGEILPVSIRAGLQLTRQSKSSAEDSKLKTNYLCEGNSIGRVGLLAGCVQQVLANDINMASIRLLNRIGFDVHVLSEIQCCGAIEQHLGQAERSVNRITANLNSWSSAISQMDALISNASGCGTMLKDYGHIFRNDKKLSAVAAQVSEKTLDICEFLADLDLGENPSHLANKYKVAYQNPCSMQHGQKISSQPDKLLEHFGFKTNSVPDSHLCCGSAGTYNIMQPVLAAQLGQNKANSLESVLPDVIASGNLGCILQLRQYTKTPVVHTVQLLDWANGGPRPQALFELN
jgi:glycolate oxidase iron-sulfur subunit